MGQDRTSEFLSLASSIPAPSDVLSHSQSSQPLTSSSHSQQPPSQPTVGRYGVLPKPSNPYAELRDFHSAASSISTDIASTSHLLSELAQLVRHRSHNLFLADDDSTRINSLVGTIKSSIESLNLRLDEAQRTIDDTKRNLGKHSQAGQEATNLVDQLRHEFVRATKGFQHVLQQRSDGMKEVEDRKLAVLGQGAGNLGVGNASLALGNRPPVYGGSSGMNPGAAFGQGGSSSVMANRAGMAPLLDLTSLYGADTSTTPAGESTSSASGYSLPRPHGIAASDTALTFTSPAASGLRSRHSTNATTSYAYTALTPVEIARMEEEAGTTLQLIPDQTYLHDRASAMNQVESNIVELGTIFNKLAVMVSEHQEMVQRIEDNVEDASGHIELSMAALTDTLSSLRTNRGLFLKVFGILVVFIILFITFFA